MLRAVIRRLKSIELSSRPMGTGVTEGSSQHSTAPAQQKEAARPAAPADPQSQAEHAIGSPLGVDIVLPGGKVEAVLARDMTADSEPRSPTREFAEDAKQIYLVLTSALASAASVETSWIAVSVEGAEPNQKLGDSTCIHAEEKAELAHRLQELP